MEVPSWFERDKNMFKTENVSPHIDRIKTQFGVCVYLIKGSERGLLIDTGMGVGDLKSYVESIWDKPYDVALTHGHCDHAGGAVQFEKVYLNEKDIELEKTHASREHRIFDVFHAPFPVPAGISEDDFVLQRTGGFEPLREDMVSDLGGVHVRWIETPGHTKGCMIPYIEEDETAIIGDALGENTLLLFPESTSVETYRKSLLHLKEQLGDVKTFLRFHGSCVSELQILDDTIELCEEVMDGKDAHISVNRMGYAGYLAREEKHPGKCGNFVYDSRKVRDDR